MDSKERGEQIVDCLKKQKYVEVSYLKELFQVSEMTVRRDLDRLEKQEVLVRVHGGARLIPQKMYEAPLGMRVLNQAEEKYLIGKYAANLIEEGDAVAFDDSSTTYAMIPYIQVKFTAITNHISIAADLVKNENAEVILLGGNLRKFSFSLVGQDMAVQMKRYHVDKVFLSAKAVDVNYGVSDATAAEGETKKAFIQSGRDVYFLFDHSKLNTCAFYNVCEFNQIKHLIINQPEKDQEKYQEFIRLCKKHHIDLHVV